MPIIYMPTDYETKNTDNEPYTSFKRKYDMVKENIHNKKIEIELSHRKGCFCDGFFIEDPVYMKNYFLKFSFYELEEGQVAAEKKMLIHMEYCFELTNINNLSSYVRKRNTAIKKRAPYYYIPNVQYLEVSAMLEDEFNKITFDAVTCNDAKTVEEASFALINQIIAITSTEY